MKRVDHVKASREFIADEKHIEICAVTQFASAEFTERNDRQILAA